MHHDSPSPGGRGTSRLLVAALAGLLTLTWLDLKRCHARRRLERTPPATPERLQTWEGEGGGIPAIRGTGTPGAASTEASQVQAAPLAD